MAGDRRPTPAIWPGEAKQQLATGLSIPHPSPSPTPGLISVTCRHHPSPGSAPANNGAE